MNSTTHFLFNSNILKILIIVQANTDALMPEELKLWHQHRDIKEKVNCAEERVEQARQNLKNLMEKISKKCMFINNYHLVPGFTQILLILALSQLPC